MLSEATSGLKVAAGRTRSSIDIVGAPPVVMLITAFGRCLITFRNGGKRAGGRSGRPSFGSRACRCTTAAPASAAPIAASAISLAVTGMCGDIDGVWIEPVTAQVMMTFWLLAIVPPDAVLFVRRPNLDGRPQVWKASIGNPAMRDRILLPHRHDVGPIARRNSRT